MSKDKREFEIKCRRCGEIKERHYNVTKLTSDFIDAMDYMIANPGAYNCSKCNKSTVHDLISYN